MRKVFWAAALLIAVAFAGCTDSGDDLDAGGPGTDGDGENDSGQTPEELDQVRNGEVSAPWEVGHTWSYSTSLGDDVTLVVSDETDDTWILDTPNEELAWFHARNDVSYLGAIGKEHLSGSQGDEDVQYFDFPLEEGEEWTTTWDGVERRIVTTEANETFRFEAYEGDHLAVEYDYDPEVGWFTEMIFHPEEEGAHEFTMELSDHDTDWSGTLVRWDAERYVNADQQALGANTDFQVSEDMAQLWHRIYVPCDQQAMAFHSSMVPVNLEPGQEFPVLAGNCTDEELVDIIEDPPAGQWLFSFYGASIDQDDPANIPAIKFEVEALGRTLESFEI